MTIRDHDVLAECAAAGIGLQFGHDAVFGGGPRWVSREEARQAVAAAGRLAARRSTGSDCVGPRAWDLAARLVLLWLALPEASSGVEPGAAELLALGRVAARLAAALPAPCPPVSSARCPPPLFAPEGEESPDARFGLDDTIAGVCDVLRDPGWTDPRVLAGLAEECRGWVWHCRRAVRRRAGAGGRSGGGAGRQPAGCGGLVPVPAAAEERSLPR
jgi:hypothetical protein